MTLNIEKTRQFITQEDEENNLVKKIESITKSLRKQYFKKKSGRRQIIITSIIILCK